MKLFDLMIDVPLVKLVKAPWNYKTDDPDMAKKLKANMYRNGQLENIVVRELPDGLYEIVNGNHRFTALIELGFESVTCANLGKISLEEAQRIAIELNETRFATNTQALSELLVGLVDSFGEKDLLFTSPFSADEMKTLTDPTLFMPPPDPTPNPEFSGDGSRGAYSPKMDLPFTFTLRFHERELIEWMTHLKNLREGYEVTRNEDALMILVRSFSVTCVEGVGGFQKVIGLLPPGVQENLKAAEQHIAQRLDEDGRDLIEDPHLRLGQILEVLTAEYIASFGA